MGYRLGRLSGKTKTFTIADVADALEQGEIRQQVRSLFGSPYVDGSVNIKDGLYIDSACALGKAAINLKVDGHELINVLDDFYIDEGDGATVSDLLVNLNDNERQTFSEIANELRRTARRLGILHSQVTVKRRTYTPA